MRRTIPGIALLILVDFLLAQQLKISEVMSNPDTLEYYCEFIEVVNVGPDTINLEGMELSIDGVVEECVPVLGDQLKLDPGQVLVIVDRGYIENTLDIYGLGQWNCLIWMTRDNAFGSTGLSNTRESTIHLFYAEQIIDSVIVPPISTGGYSWEKKNPAAMSVPEMWGLSSRFRGTPGRVPENGQGNPFIRLVEWGYSNDSVFWAVKNLGNEKFSGKLETSLHILYPDSSERELCRNGWQADLFPGEMVRFQVREPIGKIGEWFTVGKLYVNDGEVICDSLGQWMDFSLRPGVVFFTECMVASVQTGEWVEIFNSGESDISLAGVWYSDNRDTCRLPYLVLPARSFGILARQNFLSDGLDPGVPFFVLKNWLTLNNESDTLTFFLGNGEILDRMSYNFRERQLKYEDGRSLEKVDLKGSGMNWWNWALSIDPAGHTAGRKNSVVLGESVDGDVVLEPNPFSPDGDGYEDVCMFRLNFPFHLMNLVIRLFTLDGHCIKKMEWAEVGGIFFWVWDGQLDDGRKIPIGAYVVLVEARDIFSGRMQKKKKILVSARK